MEICIKAAREWETIRFRVYVVAFYFQNGAEVSECDLNFETY